MKKLLIGLTLLFASFVLKIVIVIIVLRLCGVEFGGFIGKVIDFFGLNIGLSPPQ